MVYAATDFTWFHVSVKADVWPVQDAVTWALAPQPTELHRGSSSLCYTILLFHKMLKPLNEENSKAVCFNKINGPPYLLRLFTATHTARINASATRAATTISHSVGRGERVNVSCGVSSFHRAEGTQALSQSLNCQDFFPSLHECLFAWQSASVEIEYIFIAGQLRWNTPSLVAPISTVLWWA